MRRSLSEGGSAVLGPDLSKCVSRYADVLIMTIEAWLKAACEDAEHRGLRDLKPLLETLARSTAALREADRLIDRVHLTR